MSHLSEAKPDNYHINAKICRLVEQYPCMYDRSNPFYQKKDVVEKAWVQIAIGMEDTIKTCKERWRNIRTSFARSINVNKIPSIANRTKPYYLHDELQFLMPHITPGIPIPRKRSSSALANGDDSDSVDYTYIGNESGDSLPLAVQHDPVIIGTITESEPSNHDVQIVKNHSKSLDSNLKNFALTETESPDELPANAGDSLAPASASTPSANNRPCSALYSNTSHESFYESFAKTKNPVQTEISSKEGFADPPAVYQTDPDLAFFYSLLPEIRAMTFQQKIKFKKGVYEIIANIHGVAEPVCSANVPKTSTLQNHSPEANLEVDHLENNTISHLKTNNVTSTANIADEDPINSKNSSNPTNELQSQSEIHTKNVLASTPLKVSNTSLNKITVNIPESQPNHTLTRLQSAINKTNLESNSLSTTGNGGYIKTSTRSTPSSRQSRRVTQNSL